MPLGPRVVDRVRLEFPHEFSYDEWVEFGRNQIGPAVTQLAFLIGDWLMLADDRYPWRNPWEDVSVLGLDSSVLREMKHITEHTRDNARDEHVPWGTYLFLVQRDGGVDDRPDQMLMAPRCQGCGGPLLTLSGRGRKHCDNACRQRAYRRRKAAVTIA
jgi:hypothetical protein